jgi:hypothetical protein
MVVVPIEITLYDDNDEVIKTFSRSRVSWEFFKKSLHARVPEDGNLNEENLQAIREFVCNFYDNQFTVEELIKGSDVREVLAVATAVAYKVIQIMEEQGITLPNAPTAAE